MPSKTVISPGQGLLLLIDHYKSDSVKVDQLKRLYLSGAVNPASKQAIMTLMNDPLLSAYTVSFDKRTINEDPSRRYFETHLSHETLASGLGDENIKKEDLEQHVAALKQMVGENRLNAVQHVLNGEFRENDSALNQEFADFISKIKTGRIFSEITGNDNNKKEKLILLVSSAFLGICNAQENGKALPLNIYGTGMYSDVNKGKVMLPDQGTTRSQNLGLIKGYMPLAQDDIARAESPLPYLKPSDQASFVDNAAWVNQSFDKMVHPYSNSISGTMLCQLRSLAKFKNEHQTDASKPAAFTESPKQMGNFCKLLLTTMLFGSGGAYIV